MAGSIVYQHGFTALSFFLAILAGLLIVFLIIVICVKFVRRGPFAVIHPVTDTEKGDYKKKLLLEMKSTEQRDFSTITELSTLSAVESIIVIMAVKDSLQRNRELDSLDVVSTIAMDTEIEAERSEAMFKVTWLLIESLRVNEDIAKATEDRVLQMYQKNYRRMEDDLEQECRQQRVTLFTRVTSRNKEMIEELENKQKMEKISLDKASGMSAAERDELTALLGERHVAERNAVTYKLKLDQDEASEQLRKEFSARKRIGIVGLQKQLLDDVIGQGNLSEEQADWLIQEHRKNAAAVERMYDEEIARQRMVLEEKLGQRRTLARYCELQDEHDSESLNLMAGQQLQTIKQLKKQNVLTPYDANTMAAKVTDDMMAFRNKMEKERERQEAELQQTLSSRKKDRLAETRKFHGQEISTYDKKHSEQQTDMPTEPLSFVSGRQQLVSGLRADRSELEDEVDQSDTGELEKARQAQHQQTTTDIGDYELQLLEDLKHKGLLASKAAKIMSQHKQELVDLQQRQMEEKDRQKRQFIEKLENNRENLAKQHEAEKIEQKQLWQHKTRLVRNLINGQMSLSDEERERIMKEHEKQMVKLENNLTLNKLRQKRMLEEKLAARRAAQMEQLQRKQDKQLKTLESGSTEGDARRTEIGLMKTHSQQKLALIHGEKFDIEAELEGIRVEMTMERAMALKSQEERLGGMLAALQMTKAKEIAEIEHQQTAIDSLKLNLMDDLSERGVLTDPECQAIIERHKEQHINLKSKLDAERAKQEKALRERLQKRVQMKEQTISHDHESDIRHVVHTGGNKTAAKIKKVILIQKQMLELEHFRNQMEREVSQALEDMRRQFEVKKLSALQEQELQFVAGLVRLGKFPHSELASVLALLYPSKSHEEINAQLAQIYNKDPAHGDIKNDAELLSESSGSQLTERVRAAALAAAVSHSVTTGSQANTPRPMSTSLRKKKKVPTATLR